MMPQGRYVTETRLLDETDWLIDRVQMIVVAFVAFAAEAEAERRYAARQQYERWVYVQKRAERRLNALATKWRLPWYAPEGRMKSWVRRGPVFDEVFPA